MIKTAFDIPSGTIAARWSLGISGLAAGGRVSSWPHCPPSNPQPRRAQPAPAPPAAAAPAAAAPPSRIRDRRERAHHRSRASTKSTSSSPSLTSTATTFPTCKQNDFALLDDQKAPAKVNSFHQQINLPLRVGIVIDTSTSIRSRFKFEQQSATEFLLQILKATQRPRLRDGIRRDSDCHGRLDQRPRCPRDRHQPPAAPAAAPRSSTPSTPPAATSCSISRAARNRCARP